MGREAAGLSVTVAGLEELPPAARRPELVVEAVRRAFALEKKRPRGEISVVVVGRSEMLRLNRRFLAHDWDTDVITFEHEPMPGVPPEDRPLADIYLSAWMIKEQARALGHSPLRETLTLAAHGALHLLGYTDEKPREKARMFAAQDRVLAAVGAPE